MRAETGLLSVAWGARRAGYAGRAGGGVLLYSILVNGEGGGAGRAMDAVDRRAGALLEGGAR